MEFTSWASRTVAAAATFALSGLAQAAFDPNDTTILGASFSNGASSYTEAINPLGNSVSFIAGPVGRTFEKKTQAGYTGVGISGGRTGGEIDIGETIVGSFAHAVRIEAFSFSVLFDGPEYGDWNEIAQVRATLSGGSVLFGTLQVVGPTAATWLVGGLPQPGSVAGVLPGSTATQGQAGAWQVLNPFGDASITALEFGALTSNRCGSGACNNQSDYALHGIQVAAPIPEPQTYALFGAGLMAVWFMSRRRVQG